MKTDINELVHGGTIPVYTPFLTMYYTKDSVGVKKWKMAFMMLVKDGEKIYFTPNTNGDCGGKNCKESYVVSVEETTPSGGQLLDDWLGSETLMRTDFSYNSVTYDLCSFVIDISNKNPMKARYKLEIGIHPHALSELDAPLTHEGGAVHWPGGN